MDWIGQEERDGGKQLQAVTKQHNNKDFSDATPNIHSTILDNEPIEPI